jgi:hypothetical protein
MKGLRRSYSRTGYCYCFELAEGAHAMMRSHLAQGAVPTAHGGGCPPRHECYARPPAIQGDGRERGKRSNPNPIEPRRRRRALTRGEGGAGHAQSSSSMSAVPGGAPVSMVAASSRCPRWRRALPPTREPGGVCWPPPGGANPRQSLPLRSCSSSRALALCCLRVSHTAGCTTAGAWR